MVAIGSVVIRVDDVERQAEFWAAGVAFLGLVFLTMLLYRFLKASDWRVHAMLHWYETRGLDEPKGEERLSPAFMCINSDCDEAFRSLSGLPGAEVVLVAEKKGEVRTERGFLALVADEDFEGVIPEGNYGGGTVMVWDRGSYYVHGEKPLEALQKGRIHLVLEGEKVQGDWTLIRTRSERGKNQWLLLKSDANLKPVSKKLDDQSVKTGRTMKQIGNDRDAEWQSRPTETRTVQSALKERIRKAVAKQEKKAAPKKKSRRRGKSRK